jgi:ubiquinone biosynthesis protein COQ9
MPYAADPTVTALLRAILPLVPVQGWSERAFARAARAAEVSPAEARASAPRGALDLAVAWHREGDHAMVAAMTGPAFADLRTRDKIAFALKARLDAMDDAEALRRAAALFALPRNAGVGARLLWETADAVWTALGDASRDGTWYTKRATLAAVQGAVALYRLGDDSPDLQATRAFVDRRIDEVMRFEKWKAGAGRNPLLKPLAWPLGKVVGAVRAPVRPPDLPGGWRIEE